MPDLFAGRRATLNQAAALQEAQRQHSASLRPPFVNRSPSRGVSRFDLEGALQQQMFTDRLAADDARLRASFAGQPRDADLDAAYDQMSKNNPPLPSSKRGGWQGFPGFRPDMSGGFWGDVGNLAKSSLGLAIGKPFQGVTKAWDMVGNTGLLAAEEFSEGLSGVLGGRSEMNSQLNEDGTLNDFGKQSNWSKIMDPDYGFGKLWDPANTLPFDNSWVNRGVGFVGDVGFDPITGVTGGTGRVVGAPQRIVARNTLSNARDAAGQKMFKAADLDRVGTHTAHYMDDAMREYMGMGKAGLRFGTRTHNVRIPMTGALSTNTMRGVSQARYAVMKTPLGKAMGRMRINKDLVAPMAIISGRAGVDLSTSSGQDALRVAFAEVASSNAARRGSGRVSMQFLGDRKFNKQLLKRRAKGRTDLTHELERAGAEISALGVEARGKTDALMDLILDAGGSGFKHRANYVRHMLTYRGRKALFDSDANRSRVRVQKSGEPVEFTVNEAQSKGMAFERKFKPNTTYYVDQPGGAKPKVVKLEEATIKEINEKIGGALGGVKIFEDDYAIIWEKTVSDAAHDVGVATALKTLERTHPEYVKSFNEVMGTIPRAADEVLDMGKRNQGGVPLSREAAEKMAEQNEKAVEGAMFSLDKAAKKVDGNWSPTHTDKFHEYGKSGQLGPHVKQMVDEEFEVLVTKIRADGDEVMMPKQLADSFLRVGKAVESKAFWLAMDEYTRFFKTYATLSPGFHFRNYYGGTFMNLSDGVKLVDQGEAHVYVNRFNKEGMAMFDDPSLPEWLPKAMEGAWGSGIRGSLGATEVGIGKNSVTTQFLEGRRGGGAATAVVNTAGDNPLTRLSQRWGTNSVEAPLRLAVALNTFKRATTPGEAGVFSRSGRTGVLPANRLPKSIDDLDDIARGVDLERLAVGDVVDMSPADLDDIRIWHDVRAGDDIDGLNARGMEAMVPGHRLGAGKGATGDEFLDELAYSMSTKGQQQPIELRKQPDGTWWIGEGNHRVAAANRSGMPSLKVTRGPDLREMERGVGVAGMTKASKLGGASGGAAKAEATAAAIQKRTAQTYDELADEALERVTRLHFDYSQLSGADEVARRLVPFWTFFSRNLPLQMQQMFLNPRTYAKYNHLRKNFEIGEENDIVPKQWRDSLAFKVLDTVPFAPQRSPIYATPDLPFTRLHESLQAWTDPSKMLAQANPAFRVAGELVFDRKAHSGNEFYPDENKWLYALSSLIPPVQRFDALTGGWATAAVGSDSTWKRENRTNAWAGFTGFPFKELTDSRYDAELRRMARDGG